MKRSDAIEKLARDYPWYYDDTEEILDDLLGTMIEELGFLPPKIKNPELQGNYENFEDWLNSGFHYPNHIDYGKDYYVHEWEPEND